MPKGLSFFSGLKKSFSSLPEAAMSIARACLYLLVFLVPLFYLPWTSSPLEVNKQLVLVVLSFIGLLSWLGAMLAAKRFEFRRSFVNIVAFLYLIAYTLATVFSLGKPGISFTAGFTAYKGPLKVS